MGYDVTSWFIDQTLNFTTEPKRVFMIGNSDYSERVVKWPTFEHKWDDVRPKLMNIELANADQAMNFFRQDKVTMVTSASVQIGYTHPTSGDELITMFSGMLRKVEYAKGRMKVSVADKFKQLSERKMGTDDDPVDYTGSEHLLSDIGWYMVTSQGGLSAVESTSNPDIDWDSFQAWANVMSSDNVRVKARFTGAKVTEGLRKLSRISRSAIYRKNNKIAFQRFSLVDSLQTSLNKDHLLDSRLTIDDAEVVNKQYVFFDYSVDSRYHTKSVIVQDSASVNSYGLREDTEEDRNIWYVDSVSALNLGDRVTLVKGEPYNALRAKATLAGIVRQIGEMIVHTDELIQDTSNTYRIMGAKYDMEDCMVTFELDASQVNDAFTLDVSSLDGNDVLS